MRKSLVLCLAVLGTVFSVAGCGDSKVDSKQPSLQGTPDPRLKGVGPAPVGSPGGAPGGAPAPGGTKAGLN
jgi:hypothetical protein